MLKSFSFVVSLHPDKLPFGGATKSVATLCLELNRGPYSIDNEIWHSRN